MQSVLAALHMQQKTEEMRLREAWKERERILWDRIDAAIKSEEEKAQAQIDTERKAREEEEWKRREEEEKKRVEEEKKEEGGGGKEEDGGGDVEEDS
jgi:nucleoporin GLE1